MEGRGIADERGGSLLDRLYEGIGGVGLSKTRARWVEGERRQGRDRVETGDLPAHPTPWRRVLSVDTGRPRAMRTV